MMARQKVRVTTVEEFYVDKPATASFVVDMVNKTQETYSEAGWSLSELGEKYTQSYTAEMVDDKA